jgi:hypothetical protein
MLKFKLKKLETKLMFNEKNLTFFERLFKNQIRVLIKWYLYPEFRRGNLFVKSIKENRLLIGILAFFVIWNITLFNFGKLSNLKQVKNLESKLSKTTSSLQSTYRLLNQKITTIDNLRKQTQTRQYLEYIIKRDCYLKCPDALSKLPDDIFFTMIEEIERYEIPYTIFFRVVDLESGFQFITNTSSGAYGYCQVMPSTFNYVSKILDLKEHSPVNNVKVGAYVLKDGFKRHKARGLDDKDAWFHSLVNYCGGSHEIAKKEMMYYKEGLLDTKSILIKNPDSTETKVKVKGA